MRRALLTRGGVVFTNLYASVVLADSPHTYWRLGETSGTVAADSSGNARDGTYFNSPTLGVTGLLVHDSNLAAQFDGVNDRVERADTTNLTNFTVEAWFKKAAAPGAAIVIAARDDGNTLRIFDLTVSSVGKLQGVVFSTTGGVATTITGTVTVTDGNPHHLAMTYSGSTITTYVDGVSDATGTRAAGARNLDAPFSAAAQGGAGGSNAAAIIDEVAYYTTALSGARIAAHYAAGI